MWNRLRAHYWYVLTETAGALAGQAGRVGDPVGVENVGLVAKGCNGARACMP